MPTRATRKGATAAKRAPKKSPAKARASKPQVTAPPDPALPLENAQRERFCCEYAKDSNGAQAYMRTYGTDHAGSAKTLAHRLLTKVDVRARAEHLVSKALLEVASDAHKVLVGMGRVAFSDIRKAFAADGSLLPIHELPDEIAFSIAGVEVVETVMERIEMQDGMPVKVAVPLYTKKVKFNDRTQGLQLLGKHFKLFTERMEVSGPAGGPIPVESKESPEQRAARASVNKRLAALESRPK